MRRQWLDLKVNNHSWRIAQVPIYLFFSPNRGCLERAKPALELIQSQHMGEINEINDCNKVKSLLLLLLTQEMGNWNILPVEDGEKVPGTLNSFHSEHEILSKAAYLCTTLHNSNNCT